jgi:hypothetical protein
MVDEQRIHISGKEHGAISRRVKKMCCDRRDYKKGIFREIRRAATSKLFRTAESVAIEFMATNHF